MKTYTEYRVEMNVDGSWIMACTGTPGYSMRELEDAEWYMERSKKWFRSRYPGSCDIPTAWRIVCREVTVTEWKEV